MAAFPASAARKTSAGKSDAAEPGTLYFAPGSFFVGVNYWGSESAINMWNRWNPESVELDVKALAENGVEVVRCFPLWPDFQPLTEFRGILGDFVEYGMNGGPLIDPDAVDVEMLGRFRFLCDCAQKYGVKLIPSLVTGWMSSRLMVPPALEKRNVLTDPEAIKWEVRYVRRFVRELKDHPAILAWDLGNECNCMGDARGRGNGWMWLNSIASAIRLEDPDRLVISGMHGQMTTPGSTWNLLDQGELLDVLTPHPYTGLCPEANKEPFNSLRNTNHLSAQCLMYSGIAGKPAFPEELGTLGPNIANDEVTARGMRMQMFQSWADDLPGFLWWCAFDQSKQDYPPYTWSMMERELGIATVDREPKPQLLAIKEFGEFKRSLPFRTLPPRQVDAVVLLSEKVEAWPVPLAALCLARQAGIDVKFVGAEHALPESGLYILPSPQSWKTYSGPAWDRVKAKVHDEGATLLLSRGFQMTGYAGFTDVTGVEIESQFRGGRTVSFSLPGHPDEVLTGSDDAVANWTLKGAEAVAVDQNGNPAVTVFKYGKGQVICVAFALEHMAVNMGGVFTDEVTNPLYRIYQYAAEVASVRRRVHDGDPNVTFTEHPMGDGRTMVVAINCHPEAVALPVSIDGSVGQVWNGEYRAGAAGPDASGTLSIAGNDGCIFIVE